MRGERRTKPSRFVALAFFTVVGILAVSPYAGSADAQLSAEAAPAPRTTIDFESGLSPMQTPTVLRSGVGIVGPDIGAVTVSSVGGTAMVFDADCGGSAPLVPTGADGQCEPCPAGATYVAEPEPFCDEPVVCAADEFVWEGGCAPPCPGGLVVNADAPACEPGPGCGPGDFVWDWRCVPPCLRRVRRGSR
jgi:hypothetical protein